MGLLQIDDLTETVELTWPKFDKVTAGLRPLVLPADLRGVARYLRSMGVDVEILECPGSEIVEQARAAVYAGRRIACRGRNYRQLATLVPEGYCYNVKSQHTSDQVTEILDAFNIIISPNDIFSRCQACNSNEFLKISRETAQILAKQKKTGSTSICGAASDFLVDEALEDRKESRAENEEISENRAWKLIDEPSQLRQNGKTSRGVNIQIDQVPMDLLHHYEYLYVCDVCAKCFWDGSHLKRFVNSPLCAEVLRRGEAMRDSQPMSDEAYTNC